MLLQDKTGHAHELYQLFSQYSEDLLLAVFTTMKNDGIVTKVKPHVSTHLWTCIKNSSMVGVLTRAWVLIVMNMKSMQFFVLQNGIGKGRRRSSAIKATSVPTVAMGTYQMAQRSDSPI